MWKLGKRSTENIKTCVPIWYVIITFVLKIMDVAVTCGFRGEVQQNKEFKEGDSTKKWPDSEHNIKPSIAIDVHPYPIDYENRDRYVFMAGLIVGLGAAFGVKIRWGGKWREDVEIRDNKKVTGLDDLGHFEIVGRY